MTHRGRIAGVTVPLFSLRGDRSWGLGEIADLPDFARWMVELGVKLVQILPLGEISGADTSPYAALSAFGIDPMYVAVHAVPDLDGADLAGVLGEGGRASLDHLKHRPRVDYDGVRALKSRALRRAFERFAERDARHDSERAQSFRGFCRDQRAWLDDYALFRALKDAHGGRAWFDWPSALRDREPGALREAGAKFANDVAYYRYVQWLAHGQWAEARAALAAMGVEIMGDLPFMVARDSADVWSARAEFDDGRSVGVPPDQFNAEGQDWGLPPYAWAAMRKTDFAWLRARAAYTASLYDRFRIDHLIGFYRTYSRPLDARHDARGVLVEGSFDPPKEAAQIEHGERVVSAIRDSAAAKGSQLIAEDLGVVPPFVRPSLKKLGVPGYKVLIWEKDEDGAFIDPKTYPTLSVGCFGTHDTDPVAAWFATRDAKERAALFELPELEGMDSGEKELTPELHRALVELLACCGSDLVLFMIQDLLGTSDRINTPATMSSDNWSYRLPASSQEIKRDPTMQRIATMIREALRKGRRV